MNQKYENSTMGRWVAHVFGKGDISKGIKIYNNVNAH